jgi:DNA-binding transcriptional MerR regulator
MTTFNHLNDMNLEHIQTSFSIKDLENFSGIKAHTIRVWEQRYNLFNPDRSDGNQRVYSLNELQKLLNVKLLYENGLKISKIAKLKEDEIPARVMEMLAEAGTWTHVIDEFKVAMLKFDQAIFDRTYAKLMADLSFRRIFIDIFMPLLNEIGTLWQANSITPAHEHFISSLIQQKLVAQIERNVHMDAPNKERVFVLYLPFGEIHDLGLLYLHYEIMLRGSKSIYLGQSVPMENLVDLMVIYPQITFISYFTIEPNQGIQGYVDAMEKEILNREGDELWMLGRRCKELDQKTLPSSVRTFDGVLSAVDFIS